MRTGLELDFLRTPTRRLIYCSTRLNLFLELYLQKCTKLDFLASDQRTGTAHSLRYDESRTEISERLSF